MRTAWNWVKDHPLVAGFLFVVVLAVLAALVGGCGDAGAQDQTWRYSWTAPTSGAPVEYYVAEFQSWTADGDTVTVPFSNVPGTTLEVVVPPQTFGRLRVAGVGTCGWFNYDEEGNQVGEIRDPYPCQGPWSRWSLTSFERWDAPGQPGQPVRVLVQ